MTIMTPPLNYTHIIHELDNGIQDIKWAQGQPFNYRHYSYCDGIEAGSFISSTQQYQFTNESFPNFAKSEEAFYLALNELQPKTIFERIEDEPWVEMKIFNFYPSLFRFFARLFGQHPHITGYLKHDSNVINSICNQGLAYTSVWGYEFYKKRGLPNLFLSGPSLFDFTIQFYQADPESNMLTLTFIAAERPQSLLNMFGKDRIFPTIWRIAESKSVLSPAAHALINRAETSMLELHNRVHKELITALCELG